MSNDSNCEIILWSQQAAKLVKPSFYICMIAAIIHLVFWIQFIAYPSVRRRSMQWVYAYLITDLLLLVRFFFFYIYRSSSICVPHILRLIICYCEAIFDNYLNLIQSYILLALNICRYLQIAHNHNIYSSNFYTIMIVHFLIYTFPLLGHIFTILCGWSKLESPPGDTCDLLPVSLSIQLLSLLFSYIIPVILTLVFLLKSLNYIRRMEDIRTRKIVDTRVKHHRLLVIQSSVFYSLWLIFWSPHLLVFTFYSKYSTVGTIAQVLNCISITIDPIVIAALDTRFLQAWRLTNDHVKRSIKGRHSIRIPVITYTSPSQETAEYSSDDAI